MKRYIQIVCMLLSAVAFTACNDDDRGLVVSQDTSYQLDPDYVYVDIPKEFQFDATNILYLDGKTVLNLTGKTDGTDANLVEGNEFSFTINIKKALDKDVKARLVLDETLLDGYDKGTLQLPSEDAFVLSEATIVKGTRNAAISLSLNSDKFVLTEEQASSVAGFILPLRLELVEASDELKISIEKYSVMVHVNMTFGKDNIDTSSFKEFDGEAFNNGITIETNYSGYSKPNNLIDGSTSSYFYMGYDNYLDLVLAQAEELKGFKIHIASKGSRYQLGHLTLSVDEGNGFVAYGDFSFDEGSVVYFKFKKPTNVKAIRIEKLMSVGQNKNQPDLYEFYFIR